MSVEYDIEVGQSMNSQGVFAGAMTSWFAMTSRPNLIESPNFSIFGSQTFIYVKLLYFLNN